jgi:hypothetical protein
MRARCREVYKKVGVITVMVDEVDALGHSETDYRDANPRAKLRRAARILDRLRRLSGAELRGRSAERLRVVSEAVAFSAGAARWKRERLRSTLRSDTPELREARAALDARNWPRAHANLRAHFLKRQSRFLIDPTQRHAVANAVRNRFPAALDEATLRATRLSEDRYDVLGYHDLSWRTPGGDVDWHLDPVHQRRAPIGFWARIPFLDPRAGDHKVVWELNRHQHWLALGRAAWLTGDRRYRGVFQKQLGSWLAANPPLTGTNWASMLELAFRSISWIWSLHLFVPFDDEPGDCWTVDLLLGLDRQLSQISRHLSLYFSPNTHLLGEALALYVAGRVLPELRRAARWEAIGRQVLIHEGHAQVHSDGGHAELSPHYHRYALDFYLLALAVARRTDDPAAETFAEVASRMASFCRAMADDDGRLPTIGDDDGGMLFPVCGRHPADVRDSLAIAATLLDRPDLGIGEPPEEVIWMAGGEASRIPQHYPDRRQSSQLLPVSGYAVLRSPSAHAIVDVGRFGFLNGGHAHADALSIVLSVHGHRLLIDPGTSTYTMDREVRDRFRSTAMHNTVVIDGRPQSRPAGPFHWHALPQASPTLWTSGASFDCVEGQHDGYLPEVHRRTVVRSNDLWLVADHVLGAGSHRLDAHWHVDPAWTTAGESGTNVPLYHPDGLWAAVASTAVERTVLHGDAAGLGWCAPVYGQLIPSVTVRLTQSGAAPLSLITAIAAADRPVDLAIAAASVSTDQSDGWHRTAVLGRYDGADVLLLFATLLEPQLNRQPAGLSGRVMQRITAMDGEFATDARVAVLRLGSGGEPDSLLLIEATTASWNGRGRFCLGPLTSATDLHLNNTDLVRLSLTSRRSTTISAGRTICAE